MKKLLTLTLLFVFIISSCRKADDLNPTTGPATISSTSDNTTPLISNSEIATWFVNNPIGAYIKPDWTHARQKEIGGVNIVTVPVSAIINPNPQNGVKVQSSNSLSTNSDINSFNPKHPPALYFFKRKASSDSVKAVLMNFVPDDPSKENSDSVWTGKLVDWNMQTDTARCQILVKSYVKSIDKFVIGQQNSSNNSIKSNNFWAWLGGVIDAIVSDVADVLNAIGSFLQIPGNYSHTYPGLVIDDWCHFLGVNWCSCSCGSSGGGSGGDNSSTQSSNYSGQFFVEGIYGSYVNGYNGYNDDGWNPYGTGDPCDGGGLNVASNKLKIQKLAGSPCDPSSNPQPQIFPLVTSAQAKSRFVIADIINNIQADYQINFGLSNDQLRDIADFIYNDNSSQITQNELQLDNYDYNSYDEDPPVIAQFKALIRYYFGIDNPPKTAEEAQAFTSNVARMGNLGQYIQQLHQAYRNVYGFIPGYLTLDDMIQGDGFSFSANFALDVFGGELFKFVSSPILRVGSKYVIRATELVARYPNIVNYFKEIGVHELTIIKGSAANKVIVIGERMETRVQPSINKFNQIFNSNIEPFTPSLEAQIEFAQKQTMYGVMTDIQLKATKLYQENVAWIQQKITDGYTIIDIGFDQSNPIRSVFFMMERSFIYR